MLWEDISKWSLDISFICSLQSRRRIGTANFDASYICYCLAHRLHEGMRMVNVMLTVVYVNVHG